MDGSCLENPLELPMESSISITLATAAPSLSPLTLPTQHQLQFWGALAVPEVAFYQGIALGMSPEGPRDSCEGTAGISREFHPLQKAQLHVTGRQRNIQNVMDFWLAQSSCEFPTEQPGVKGSVPAWGTNTQEGIQ